RFYVERVLGAREGLAPSATAASADEVTEPEVADEMPDPGPPRALALGIGNAVHAALEWSANNGWDAPDDELLALMLSREGVVDEPEALARVRALVAGWLSSELREELAD